MACGPEEWTDADARNRHIRVGMFDDRDLPRVILTSSGEAWRGAFLRKGPIACRTFPEAAPVCPGSWDSVARPICAGNLSPRCLTVAR